MKKRLFDLTLCFLTAPLWLLALLATSLAIWLREGRPVFYVSERRVWQTTSLRLIKFRTMILNAERVANRATVPIHHGVRFLNIPPDSPLYTPVGRFIERWHLTEIPQFLHVLTGRMSIVGNRPLPENVITSLKEGYPQVEERFLTKGGLTGLVQLIGRDALTDNVRLAIEISYCRAISQHYSVRLDFLILLLTVQIALGLRQPFSAQEVFSLLEKYTQYHSEQQVIDIYEQEPLEKRAS